MLAGATAALVVAAVLLIDLGDDGGRQSASCSSAEPEASPSVSKTTAPSGGATAGVEIEYLGRKEFLRGVNVFDLQSRVDVGVDCTAQNPASSFDFLAARGVDIVRLAVPWSFLQPKSAGESTDEALARDLNPAALRVLRSEIASIGRAGMRVVLDLHNNGTYPASQGDFPPGTVWFGNGISKEQAQTIWKRLSDEFKDDQNVAAYDLFNEVRLSMVDVATYKAYIQAVVDAIRANGDSHTVWVEGMKEASTGGLADIAPNGPWVEDQLDRVVYSQHFYPGGTGTVLRGDPDSSTVDSAFLSALTQFGEWCSRFEVRCSVGEVGWPSDESLGGGGQSQSWTRLGERFYELADRFGMDVTYFGSTRKADCGWLMAYCGDGVEIDDARSQSAVIEAHPSR